MAIKDYPEYTEVITDYLGRDCITYNLYASSGIYNHSGTIKKAVFRLRLEGFVNYKNDLIIPSNDAGNPYKTGIFDTFVYRFKGDANWNKFSFDTATSTNSSCIMSIETLFYINENITFTSAGFYIPPIEIGVLTSDNEVVFIYTFNDILIEQPESITADISPEYYSNPYYDNEYKIYVNIKVPDMELAKSRNIYIYPIYNNIPNTNIILFADYADRLDVDGKFSEANGYEVFDGFRNYDEKKYSLKSGLTGIFMRMSVQSINDKKSPVVVENQINFVDPPYEVFIPMKNDEGELEIKKSIPYTLNSSGKLVRLKGIKK